ncbi:mucolipin-3 isoform X2 [Astyanax mexicanus]|uniref:mucolipin-3 isoform X2 n=1 Tax=Astyanax mexicanus TaxID=7994 RepID=UPI0020CB2A09|nr:mucolipin-3 isoform X2 [Astyanax mexicanus]
MSDPESADGRSDLESRALEELRRKLKFFFMSPCEKNRSGGRRAWKLTIHILKITIITIQLILFGLSNERMVRFTEENLVTFKHLFLKDFQHRNNVYSIYTERQVNHHIHHAIMRYLTLQNVTVGNHVIEKIGGVFTPLSLCQEFYRHDNISPSTETFSIDPQVEKECFQIHPVQPFNQPTPPNLTLDLKRLLSVNIYLNLKAINLQTVRFDEFPDCYKFHITVELDNRARSGRVKVSLSSEVQISVCKDFNISGSNAVSHLMLVVAFDSLVILTCLLSLTLCIGSLRTGVQLLSEYSRYVSAHCGRSLRWCEWVEFIKGWHVFTIISDTLTITGSALKICIHSKELVSYRFCSTLLGTGTVLVWMGVLRYLGFFQKYNILILTLQAALPSVIRFSLCAVLIYLSYCFCGWIVLGPHHENFRSFNRVVYCLFSMINGDEVYSTFRKLREWSWVVWLFSRIYIYTFISIFTYMVLSLFIAIITDTYHTIRQDSVVMSEVEVFIVNSRNAAPRETDDLEKEDDPVGCSTLCCCSH